MSDAPQSRNQRNERGRYTTTILYVDSDADRRESATATIRNVGDHVGVVTAATVDEGRDRLHGGVDGAVVVHDPPTLDATAVLDAVDNVAAGLPVVVRTGVDHVESLGGRLFEATDYYLLDSESDAVVADRITSAAAERDRYVRGPTPVALLRADGTVVDANDTAETVLGIDTLRTHVADAEWTSTSTLTRADLSALLDRATDGETVRFQTTIESDAAEFLLEGTLRPLGGSEDVDRVVLQADPLGGERDWAAIVDRMTDAFLAVDEAWRLTYVNDEAATVIGAAMGDPEAGPAELEGRHLWETLPEARGTIFEAEYTTAMETQSSRSFTEYYDPLDAWFDVRVYPSATGLSVYFTDVTERQRQREQLEQRERVLRDVYTVVADGERSFEEQVQGLLEIGCSALDLEYGTLSRIEGDEYVFEVVEAPPDTLAAGDVVPLSATNCERTVTTEQTVVLGDIEAEAPELTDRAAFTEMGIACYIGAPVVVDGEMYGTFCFYDEGSRSEPFTEWETTLVDLLSQWLGYEIDRVQTHENLQAQNDRLEQFASIVSHDLRNPLDVAINRLDLLETAEADAEHVEAIRRSHDRIAALIEDLLVLAREGADGTDLGTASLDRIASDAWTQVDTGDATLAVRTDRCVRADAGHLQRVFENLFRNAIEHGSKGSDDPLTVTVGDTDDGFYVADDGRGIDAEDPESVFEAGVTDEAGGTGLGLAIVRRLADAHDWTVRVTEADGGGASFVFEGVEFSGE